MQMVRQFGSIDRSIFEVKQNNHYFAFHLPLGSDQQVLVQKKDLIWDLL